MLALRGGPEPVCAGSIGFVVEEATCSLIQIIMHMATFRRGYPRGRETCDLSNDFRRFIKNCSFPLHAPSLAYRLAMLGHARCRISEYHGRSVLTRNCGIARVL